MSKNRKFVGMWAEKEELISLGIPSYKQQQADRCIPLLRKELLAALKGPQNHGLCSIHLMLYVRVFHVFRGKSTIVSSRLQDACLLDIICRLVVCPPPGTECRL